jgi:hypothetical protein
MGQFENTRTTLHLNSTALIWRGKVPVDLNTLIPADSQLHLIAAESINDSGDITGQGVTASGELHAFLATRRH